MPAAIVEFARVFAGPNKIGVDQGGNVFVNNGSKNTISKITPSGIVISNFASVGVADMAIDPSGNIFTINGISNIVTRIAPDGGVMSPWVTIGAGNNGLILTTDPSGNVFVAYKSITDECVAKISSNGNVTPRWGVFHGNTLVDIVSDPSGNIFVVNTNAEFGAQNYLARIAANGSSDYDWVTLSDTNDFVGPAATDPSGNIYIANSNNTVSKITAAGSLTQTWATLSSRALGIATDRLGNIYTANANGTVSKISPTGTVTQTYGTIGSSPAAIVIDLQLKLYAANTGADTVSRIVEAVPLSAML